MIYTPKDFQVHDVKIIADLISRYNFATLLVGEASTLCVSHLPFLFEHDPSGCGKLYAHMARANPQWKAFAGAEVAVLFQGPHSYISPRWYTPAADNVPTWNYAVVHAYGSASVVKDKTKAFDIMGQLVRWHDPSWNLNLSDSDREEMMNQVVVFEILVSRMDAKFKMSQNRSSEDQNQVMGALANSQNALDHDTARWMKMVCDQ